MRRIKTRAEKSLIRRIQTQAEIDKNKRNKQIIIGVVLIGLLVVAPLGYSLFSRDNEKDGSKVNENGVDFLRQNGVWFAEIDGGVFRFQNLPSEVADVDVDVLINLGQYSGQPLYFVNPNEGVSEILGNIGNYVLRYQEACLENSTCEGDLPVKSCDSNLIIFVEGNETSVYQDGSCVYIVGDSLRATDAFLYKVLQVTLW